jgi:hypothetical protein
LSFDLYGLVVSSALHQEQTEGHSTNLSFPGRLPLQFEEVMELLGICLTITYFQFEPKFYQEKEGMATETISGGQ